MKRLNGKLLVVVVALGLASPSLHAAETVAVSRLSVAPSIDGDLSDWSGNWQRLSIKPAMEGDNKNRTGDLDVEIQVGVAGDEIFIAARWPDSKADLEYKPWYWKKNKYKRGKNRDDMFAVRFDMGGDFNSCMVEDADYEVDVWLWSAGRSNQKGYATDMWHKITLNIIEQAAEYETPSGQTVYIKKSADEGLAGFANTKPKRKQFVGDKIPGIKLTDGPKGSIADVAAMGIWKDGFWHLELKRKLDTGHNDDVVLAAGKTVKGQIAVFNKGFAEHKSVTGELLFDFTAL